MEFERLTLPGVCKFGKDLVELICNRCDLSPSGRSGCALYWRFQKVEIPFMNRKGQINQHEQQPTKRKVQ
jgi:hypothetical protein